MGEEGGREGVGEGVGEKGGIGTLYTVEATLSPHVAV